MKLKDIVTEGKNGKPLIPPRNKNMNDALLAKKSGGHYSERLDYKRSKEKQKSRKEVKAALSEEA